MHHHLQHEYLHSQHYFTLLTHQIPLSQQIKPPHIYIHPFYQFTPHHLLLVQHLLLHPHKITAPFTVHPSY
ncbi:hypothetical protein, partial [Bacillus sp. WP8]|uniref:hypothetical protein n=1 Tax=Bacillus sp. WP8 TaxID=756828 RepID=UPI0037C0524A